MNYKPLKLENGQRWLYKKGCDNVVFEITNKCVYCEGNYDGTIRNTLFGNSGWFYPHSVICKSQNEILSEEYFKYLPGQEKVNEL